MGLREGVHKHERSPRRGETGDVPADTASALGRAEPKRRERSPDPARARRRPGKAEYGRREEEGRSSDGGGRAVANVKAGREGAQENE